MPSDGAALLISLLLVHVLLDFPLQPYRWVTDRYQRHAASPGLYLHAAVHGIAAFACFLAFGSKFGLAVLLGSIILVAHFLTDLGKSFLPRHSLMAFVLDQLAHGLVLLGVWACYVGFGILIPLLSPLLSALPLLLILAYLVILLPTSIVISLCLKPWIKEIRNIEGEGESLARAGAMIGYLERILILTFVILGEYTAIGFVLALKTAFRFKDTEDRRKAEYMMMGTFLSFALTIGVGLSVRYIMAFIQ
jgi:hypothetical protein